MNIQAIYKQWCARTDLTAEEGAQLEALRHDETAMLKAFGDTLHFGTAGLRGLMGMGPNCINRFTIAGATAGVCEWLASQHKQDASVVISTDSRLNHELFAQTAATVLAERGFQVLLWDKPMPTPMLSWSVRHFGCASGIMITASHNPKNYNGYKVYDANGCQLLSADAEQITQFADQYFNGAPLALTASFDALVSDGRIRLLSEEAHLFLDTVLQTTSPLQKYADIPITIGFTPLHGVGGWPVKTALEALGMRVICVDNQFEPNGEFPTIATPNPELPVAFDGLSLLAQSHDCDVLLATDPDCDRIGIAVPTPNGLQLITGNQLGALLIDFISEFHPVKPGDTVVTTTVTSALGKETARFHGFDLEETFTGFKYIGNCITDIVNASDKQFIFGYEESYGFLFGTHARDKDAVVTALLCALMAQHDKAKGQTILNRLEGLYQKVGAYADRLINLTFDPIPGKAPISDRLMACLRQHPPETFADVTILKNIDYLNGIDFLPKENVIQYNLSDGSVISFRPSGTEPKMKCYITARGETLYEAEQLADRFEQAFQTLIAQLKEEETL